MRVARRIRPRFMDPVEHGRWRFRAAAAAPCVVAVLALNGGVAQAATFPPTVLHLKRFDVVKAGILVIVSVSIQCGPLDTVDPGAADSDVLVYQAAGTAIASGRGSLPSSPTCDGAHHWYKVRLTADPTGPPFAAGEAVVQANGGFCGTISGHYGCSFDSVGPLVVTLLSG